MGYDTDCKDYDNSLLEVIKNMHTGKPKIKQRQMPFQMHISTIFREVIFSHGVRPNP